jgi:heme-degrading monooxygenase HmoA
MRDNCMYYASGSWYVTGGSEEDFVSGWTEFLDWTRESAAGFRYARLIRDSGDPRHFISFAGWESAEGMDHWRSLPAFTDHLDRCRALCDDFRGSSYTLVASVRA